MYGFTMLPSYYEALRPLPDDMRLQLYEDYAFQGKEPEGLSPILAGYFTLLRPNIDNSIKHYSSSVENGRKGGRPKKPSENPMETQTEPRQNREKDKEMDMETETEMERETETAAQPPAPARDSRGIVLLSDEQYKALLDDMGETELLRCINYVSEYSAMSGRTYKDWSAAVAKCHRQQWGVTTPKGAQPSADFQPSSDRIQQHNEWIDSFL